LITFLLALNYLPFAILGSSASNLFRTKVLQRCPFPTDFGNNGDGAWGLFNALHIQLGIFPACISTFRQHRKPHRDPDPTHDADGRMIEHGMQLLQTHLEAHPSWRPRVAAPEVQRIFAAKQVAQRWRARLKEERRRLFPWSLNPIAWRARHRRQQSQARCETLVNELLNSPQSAFSREPRPNLRSLPEHPDTVCVTHALAAEADVVPGT